MNPLTQQIVDLRDEPESLERLYRASPREFADALSAARAAAPAAIALRVWEARLFLETEPITQTDGVAPVSNAASISLLIFLCAVSGTMAKLPAFFPRLDNFQFYSRNFPFFVLPAIAGFFLSRVNAARRQWLVVGGIFIVSALVVNGFPRIERSDSIELACLHLPFFLWTITGVAFAAAGWRDKESRIAYLRLNGEAIIYFALIVISGGLMTAITISLFVAIKLDIADWYFKWIVVYGACSAPIVAMHLALERTRRGFAIAPLLARIFSPLALVTLVLYLGAMAIQRRSPYSDREFLIVFNAMLLCVLAIAVFCICERKAGRFFDALLCALVVVALVIDVIALTAIIYRLASFGFTPNRTATLVANLLVFVNLAGILFTFARATYRQTDAVSAKESIARFLPAYAIWTAIVTFGFPLIFHFK